MRLSDAGLRRLPTKLLYRNHRPSPWLIEDAAPRSLEPIVRCGLYGRQQLLIEVAFAGRKKEIVSQTETLERWFDVGGELKRLK
jgi:hypothetical protein